MLALHSTDMDQTKQSVMQRLVKERTSRKESESALLSSLLIPEEEEALGEECHQENLIPQPSPSDSEA